MRENGMVDTEMIKGGLLAWLLWQGGVVNSVVELGAPTVSGSTGKK